MDAMQKLFSKKGGDTNGVPMKKEVVQGTEFTVRHESIVRAICRSSVQCARKKL